MASSKALDLLHWGMCTVTYRHITMAIKMASFAGVFVDCCLYAYCPGNHWGDTEQVVARCRRPVASRVAVDMPHWAMPSVLLRHTAVAIKMASLAGVFVDRCLYACCPGSRWGNTEQVVARCRRPVASGVALNMPHWAMLSVSLRRICKAFKTGRDRDAF